MRSSENKNQLTRRSFLKKTSMATSLASISPLTTSSIFSASTDDKRIIVVGAGLAGLSCAYELDQAGFNVILIEARSRPGGRVSTYRDPFADNLYAEMGAEYVDSTDMYVKEYCKKFDEDYMILDEPNPNLKIIHFAGPETSIHDCKEKWIEDNWK